MTFTGYTYIYKGIEDWSIGDISSCIMYDNETNVITDDMIIDIRYSGWAEGWSELVK